MANDGILRKTVYIDGAELIFAEKNSEKPHSELAKQILFRLLSNSGLGLYKAVEIAKENHPSMTSAQNIGNKLKRGTLDLLEMVYLAEACGYRIDFKQETSGNKANTHDVVVSEEEAQPQKSEQIIRIPPKEERGKSKTKSIAKLIEENYTVCKGVNFPQIIIAGKNAEEAAQWFTENLQLKENKNIDETQEAILMIAANRQFGVWFKPISTDINTNINMI